MANINHSTLTDPYLHEPKGAGAAANGQVYIADGAGSGAWIYPPGGWGYYKDGASAQTFNTTQAKISIDGAGGTTDENYLPREIRGSASLWDTTNDKITPIRAGDSYDIRLDLPITAKSGSPTELTIELDIAGSTYGSATVILNRFLATGKTPPYSYSVAFPIFCLTTFATNGGQFWLSTDTGTLDITAPAIYIGQNTNGAI
jgi:hypothetical protein